MFVITVSTFYFIVCYLNTQFNYIKAHAHDFLPHWGEYIKQWWISLYNLAELHKIFDTLNCILQKLLKYGTYMINKIYIIFMYNFISWLCVCLWKLEIFTLHSTKFFPFLYLSLSMLFFVHAIIFPLLLWFSLKRDLFP